MPIQSLSLTNFTVFQKIDLNFSPGLNVIIGENATGKSHLLKLLYALVKTGDVDQDNPSIELKDRLAALFRPDSGRVGRLARTGEQAHCRYHLTTNLGELVGTLEALDEVNVSAASESRPLPALFLPAREVLSMYEGFVPLYQSRALSFDATYYDTCVALQALPLRGPAKAAAEILSAPIYRVLGGRVELDGPRFYVDIGDGNREAHLVAEGLRKLATLAHLIDTGAIAPGTILFWDEPEANLNPRLIARLAEPLVHLANSGVQIFLSTHDFLLPHRLSLMAEFGRHTSMQFFSLSRDDVFQDVQIESAPLITELRNNPILDEYARYYEDQRELYRKNLQATLQEDPT